MGTQNEPVPADMLYSLFLRIRKFLDQAVAHESGLLSHFEVFTCVIVCQKLLEKGRLLWGRNLSLFSGD